MQHEPNIALGFALLMGLIFGYVLPTFIAFMRGHQNAAAITAVNILLGWTFLGWVAALVWSLTAVTRKPAAG